MTAHEQARRFLDQLRAQTQAALGTGPTRIDPAAMKDAVDQLLRASFRPEEGQHPQVRAAMDRWAARYVESYDDAAATWLAAMQDLIEKTAAERIQGVEVGPRRPLVGHLQTGQLNAVSMRVPGSSGAYLVIFEDQLVLFTSLLSDAVAGAMPRRPVHDKPGTYAFELSVPAATEWIEAKPAVAHRFADIITTYAVTGSLRQTATWPLEPPDYRNASGMLTRALDYFVLGHEYAHILLSHLDVTQARKGVLPAAEAEVLPYSWRQEFEADSFGMILSINTGIEHDRFGDLSFGFLGVSLFFDALDVMDRAVALLETGDEDARQLGSHPPPELRKQNVRAVLPYLAGDDTEMARTALGAAEVQGEIIRLLWERTRPVLLDLRRRGVPAARSWRTIPKETGDSR